MALPGTQLMANKAAAAGTGTYQDDMKILSEVLFKKPPIAHRFTELEWKKVEIPNPDSDHLTVPFPEAFDFKFLIPSTVICRANVMILGEDNLPPPATAMVAPVNGLLGSLFKSKKVRNNMSFF